MCVEVVKSMALNPTRSITGAMLSVFAVSMPVAPHRHWLPSRSEVSTSCNSAMATHALRIATFEMAGQIAGVDAAGGKFCIRQHFGVQGEIAGHALQARRADGSAQPRQRAG